MAINNNKQIVNFAKDIINELTKKGYICSVSTSGKSLSTSTVMCNGTAFSFGYFKNYYDSFILSKQDRTYWIKLVVENMVGVVGKH